MDSSVGGAALACILFRGPFAMICFTVKQYLFIQICMSVAVTGTGGTPYIITKSFFLLLCVHMVFALIVDVVFQPFDVFLQQFMR